MSLAIKIIVCSIVLMSASLVRADQPFDRSEPFPADTYPSQRAALKGLANQCADLLRRADGEGSSVELIAVLTSNSEVDATNVRAFSDALASALPGIQIAKDGQEAPATIRLSVNDVRNVKSGWSKSLVNSGRLSATMNVEKQVHVLNVGFSDKPWADDWQMFVNAHPSDGWITSRSPSPGTSADEAIASARQAAASTFLARVESELNARAARSSDLRMNMTHDWLEQRVIKSLTMPKNDGIVVRDTFVQKFSRPYGDVWQASVLIDASPKVIGQLADAYSTYAEANVGKKATGAAAVGGMVASLALLYAFINAVTKGYFMWRLRAVALLAAIAGILAVFAVV